MPYPRAVAIALIRHPVTGALFVDELQDLVEGETFHRPSGGGIEFGESAVQTLTREFQEEYGLDIVVGPRIATVENLFVHRGRAGHEIMLVHAATFADPADYDVRVRECLNAPGIRAVWREASESTIPLYPAGLPA